MKLFKECVVNSSIITNTLRYIRNLKDRCDVSRSFKSLLETIMSGAMWPASRVHQINPFFSDLCPRCGTAPETSLHAFWTCPCNSSIEESIIEKTNKYVQRAVEEADLFPCMWFRGLLPSSMTDAIAIPTLAPN